MLHFLLLWKMRIQFPTSTSSENAVQGDLTPLLVSKSTIHAHGAHINMQSKYSNTFKSIRSQDINCGKAENA